MARKKRPPLFFVLMGLLCATTSWDSWARQDWPSRTHFGVVPVGDQEAVMEKWKPVMEHLEKALGVKVRVITEPDDQRIIDLLDTGKIDLAHLSPNAYVLATEKAHIEPLVLQTTGAERKRGFHWYLISKTGSGIDSLEKAKGKVFAFTDSNSTVGFLLPKILFYRDMNTSAEAYFSKTLVSGSHRDALLGVKTGKYDVVATNDMEIARLEAAQEALRDDFIVLWKSEPIPGAPIVARTDLPGSLKEAILNGLKSFNRETEALKKPGFTGFDDAKDRDYNVIRYLNRLTEEMKLDSP